MGEFLTTPNKEKESDLNENSYIRYGSCGMQGWRKRMEDAHITDISKGNDKHLHIFGVFDGHGGKEVSQFVKNHFTQEFLSNKNINENIEKALKETFFKMDELMRTAEGQNELKEHFKKSKIEDDEQDKKSGTKSNQMEMFSKLLRQKDEDEIALGTGCTACVCVIDEKNKKIYFANAGDSRVVLCKNGVAFPMSIDHKPELENEKNRIYKAEGWISEGRVKGNLNLCRGFGDLEYKSNTKLKPEEQMITADPDIQVENITNECDFVIVACDGIWDCLTNQEACDYVKQRIANSPLDKILEEMLDSICADNIYNETGVGCDNMTCLIIEFKK